MAEAATRTPEQIRRDIEHTRDELAHTAAALAERADVKARAQEKVGETRAQLRGRVAVARRRAADTALTIKSKASEVTPATVTERVRADPIPFALVGGFVGGALIGWIASRR